MKFYFTIFCSMLLSFIISTSSILANIINVPTDQPTIQAGINAALNGDTVLVAESLYYENIDFNGKAITVASFFLIDGDTSHISNTIIDGSQPSNPNNGSVVYLINGEDTTSVLCGFTITGGTGTIYPNNNRIGGGIHILNASACIKNNYIEFNTINNTADGFGAGVFAEELTNNDLIIKNNIIRNNDIISANTVDWSLGAGIKTYADGSETVYISGNRILNNTISATLAYGCGITPANAGYATYFITNNIISGNVINALGGGSGGIDVYNQIPVIQNNVITNNSAPIGGGMGIEITSEKSDSGRRGNGKFIVDYKNNLKSTSLIVKNLSNNTVVGNSATSSGGGIGFFGGGNVNPVLMNFIIWGNSAPNNPQLPSTADVQYSNVEGGHSDTTNINSDPLFADTINYYLSAISPCIDAGNPDTSYNDPDGSRNDMGAYGGPNSITGLFIIKDNNKMPGELYLKQNYPNPFNPRTTIEFSIPKTEFVTLKIYNLLGQEVATLVSDRLKAGNYNFTWDASSLASGMYFYELKAGDPSTGSGSGYVQTRKMVYLK
jgi:hypothetical protein